MTFCLGLTGSIGMGKSTTAAMFSEEGVPVWDADAAVHRLYAAGGAAAEILAKVMPDVIKDGAVSRDLIKAAIARDPSVLSKIEGYVHPLVAADRAAFAGRSDEPIILFDIPLLFETGADVGMDAVVVVSAPPALQKERVLARPGITEAQFEMILARQMPDAEKRARADYVIETVSLDDTRAAVRDVLTKIRGKLADA
ncbi:MAG: dephospho-CoA kinase [Flavimaricola sp.]|nr:dephospho-CoA kinase [Flavimaricola sp.]